MMQIRYGILNIIRSWKKSLAFFVLLAVVTAAAALAAGVCQTAEDFLRQCKEGYITIARFTYEQSECGSDGYDSAVWAAAEELVLPDGYAWDPSRVAAGTIDGVTRTDTGAFGNNAAVVEVRVSSFDSHTGIYAANVSESLFSRTDRTGQMIYLVYDGKLENNHKYLIHGTWFRRYSGIINLGVAEFQNPKALSAGFDGSAAAMIVDVTDGTADRTPFEMLAMYYRETSSFIPVTATGDLEAFYPFQQNQLTLAQGTGFRAGDGMVCVISDMLAESMGWNVGDRIELSLSVPQNADLYDNYWPEIGYDATEWFTIIGLFEGTAEHRYAVYIPSDSVPVMDQARCGTALGQLRVPSDQAEAFSMELPAGVRMTILDQGYGAAAAPFRDILRSAHMILAACTAAALAVILLFGFLFVYRQRDVVKNMVRLGADRTKQSIYFLSGSGLLAVLAAGCGMALAEAASSQVEDYLLQTLASYNSSDLRYSISNLSVAKEIVFTPSMKLWVFAAAAATVWVCAMFVCLIFVRMASKPTGKRRILRRHRGSSRSLSGGAAKFALLSALRGGGKTLTPLCTVLFGVFLLGLLPHAQQRYDLQLDQLRTDTKIIGWITSNDAQLHDDIHVGAQQLKALWETDIAEEYAVSKNCHYMVSDGTIPMPVNEYQMETLVKKILMCPRLVSTNNLLLSPEFRYAQMQTRWLDGYSAADLDLRELDREWSGPYRAVASEVFLQERNLELGDTVELWFTQEDGTAALTSVELIGAYATEHDRQNLYVELGFSMGPGWQDTIERMRAYRRDPLARISFHSVAFRFSASELSQVKQQLEQLGFSEAGRFDRERRWVVLDDRDYLSREETMEQRAEYMALLFPVVYGILECLALAAAWVLTLHHRRDYAVMRAQGASSVTAFFSVFWNQVLLCLLGAGIAVSGLYLMQAWTETGVYLSVSFVLLWLLGSGMAVASMNKKQIVTVLKAAE